MLLLLLLLYRSHTRLNLSISKFERRTHVKRMVLRNVVEIDEEKTAVSTLCAKNVKEVRRLEKSVFKECWKGNGGESRSRC